MGLFHLAAVLILNVSDVTWSRKDVKGVEIIRETTVEVQRYGGSAAPW